MNKKNLEIVCKKLGHLLADIYVLYIKTLNFHWNMEGSEFFMYHKLLQSQYEELSEAADEVAERIRQLGKLAPCSMKEFLALARLKESSGKLPMATMIKELVKSHEQMVDYCRDIVEYCDEHKDLGTSDLIVTRMRSHDKEAWLLRSNIR
ncbi:MAG: Dps family protein [Chlamydiales bacterium]